MKKYFWLFILSFTIFVFHAIYVNHAIYGDGNGYYTYTQSIYFDREINSPKILDYLQNFQGRNYVFSRVFWNRDANPYLAGTGIVWLPSMAFMNIFSNDRFDLIHELGPGLTGILLMLSGLYFLEKYLTAKFSKNTAFWTILTIFFGTNVFYYTAFEPALSHQPAFFIICLLLYLTVKENVNFFIVGLLAGLMAITRTVDLIFLVPIFLMFKISFRQIPDLLLGALIAIFPQIYVQKYLYGDALTNPYLTGANGTWGFNFKHFMEYLFSPKRGLFFWTPALLPGFFGLIESKRKVIAVTLIVAWLIHSSWSAYLSAGFGQRFSFSAIPFFAIGIAYLYEKFSLKNKIASLSIFTVWNFLMFIGFYLLKWKNAA